MYSGLCLTDDTLGKAPNKFSERPQFRELFNPINLIRPFSVKCSLCLINSKHSLNIIKSETFSVTRGYLSAKNDQ